MYAWVKLSARIEDCSIYVKETEAISSFYQINMRTGEDRELDIRLMELQIRHQHIASVYTILVSITASLSVAVSVGYITVGITLKNSIWTVNGIAVLVVGLLLTYIIWDHYMRRIKQLKKEFQELKKEYLW